MSNRIEATHGSERIDALDVLRGFALLGILSVNIGAFSMPSAAYFDPTAYGDLSGINGLVWGIVHLFADLKFMAIFAMLFGAGIVLMSERLEASGSSAAGTHYRRMFWLIVFGLLHAHLLWYGDILYWYGMCGLIVYLFRKRSPTTLILAGILLLAVSSAFMLLGGLSADQWPPEARQSIVSDLKPSEEVKAAEIAAYQAGWLEQMDKRVPASLEMQTATFLAWAFWRVSGLMLLGMALFKLRILTAERSRRTYWILIAIALIGGLPLVASGISYNFAIDWKAPDFFLIGLQFNYWGSILVSLGWIGAILLICKSGVTRLTRPLAAVGRTAFSNYILQTLICTTIFYGHGLGLFGTLERLAQLALVMVIWVFQVTLSSFWLRHFRCGPLEWLWRSLVYLHRQPFRREMVQAQ